jgi:hypothetical protein
MNELKTTIEATLNSQTITINKLKAGKYYEAQKIFIGMIESVRKQIGSKVQGKDIKDIKEVVEKDLSGVNTETLYEIFPKEVAKLVSFCIDVPVEKLLTEAYPEEISDIAEKVIKLNNFAENLKNSVAPMGSLGAQKN